MCETLISIAQRFEWTVVESWRELTTMLLNDNCSSENETLFIYSTPARIIFISSEIEEGGKNVD